MSAKDPHANHAVPDTNAAVRRSMVEVTLAATPMLTQDGSVTSLAKELEGRSLPFSPLSTHLAPQFAR
ncbi:hypothetical protein [Candidatus Villigracilis affinis]|uniref:hypothetical protein n=1 Tax=Candidatus Villigracilis affinis TaxID=3140682 RepID=UPI002A1A3AF4|nr:hypothetical protein [Anaerolineales bacterium]